MNKHVGLLILSLVAYAPQAKPIKLPFGFGGMKEFKVNMAVMGIGGAGGNIVSDLVNNGDFPEGLKILVANTDVPDLKKFKDRDKKNRVPSKNIIQLGRNVARGEGAGAKPDIAAKAAEESMPEIISHLKGLRVLFLVAGLGGGTGSGAIVPIVKAAKEMGALVVALVTLPARAEGDVRDRNANATLEAILKEAHSVIVAKNQSLFDRLRKEKEERAIAVDPSGFKSLKNGSRGPTTVESNAFANGVLSNSIKTLNTVIQETGEENLDFADICAVMKDIGGLTIMGSARASGEDRAIKAVKEAVLSSLFPELTIDGARGVLVNIRGCDVGTDEKEVILEFIRSKTGRGANIIPGLGQPDQSLQDTIIVDIIATGLDTKPLRNQADNAKALPKSALVAVQEQSEVVCPE